MDDHHPAPCPQCGNTAVTRWMPPSERPCSGSTIVDECPCGMAFNHGPPPYPLRAGKGDGGTIFMSKSDPRTPPP